MNTPTATRPRHLQRTIALAVAATLAAIALLYALAGFVLLPWYAKRELPRMAEEKMQRHASAGEIKFNPFTLALEVGDFALTEKDGRPLVGFKHALVDVEWRSLVQRAVIFGQIRLDAPSVHIGISPDGHLNLAALAGDESAPPKEPRPAAPPRLVIGDLQIEGGTISLEDQRVGYKDRFEQLTFKLTSLSTFASDKGPYTLSARTPGGAILKWQGEATISPLVATGTIALEHSALPELQPFLKGVVNASITDGHADVELPYHFSLPDGRPRIEISNGRLAIDGFALAAGGKDMPSIKLGKLTLDDVVLELTTLAGGATQLDVKRGRFAARSFVLATAGADALSVALDALAVDNLALNYAGSPDGKRRVELRNGKLDAGAVSLTTAGAKAMSVKLRALALDNIGFEFEAGTDGKPRMAFKGDKAAADTFSLGAAGADTPSVTFSRLALETIALDLAAHTAKIGALRLDSPAIRASRDENGVLDLATLLAPRDNSEPSAPWQVALAALELTKGSFAMDDRGVNLAYGFRDIALKLRDVTSDFARPVAFDLSAALTSGGTLSTKGRVAVDGTADASVDAAAIALTPLQPLIARYANVTLVSGEAAFSGTIKSGRKNAALVYTGGASISNVLIQDPAGVALLGWKSLATTTLRAQVASMLGWQSLATTSLRSQLVPTDVRIDLLRWQEPSGKVAIAADKTTNLRRAIRHDDVAAAPAAPSAAAGEAPSPAIAKPAAAPETADNAEGGATIQIRRIDIKQGTLEFSDQSLAGGFSTSIHELDGTLNGISSDRSTRSQLALEGRVDEFGYAKVSGSLNPFIPRDRSNVRMEFRNLDVTRVTPYMVRFAGYRVASGRLSLDLNYRVRNNLLEGDNQIVLDQFTLGEKVDSPGALDLPLGLAIALLKDADGKIDVAVPVSGNLDDPQFDYGQIIHKAIVNLITGIITAPFRLIGRLFGGGSGEEAGQIAFDPGSARLLPPEREKIGRIVQMLGKRPELKLAVPARYDSDLDARALKRAALRRELGKRARLDIEDEDPPGPLNIDDRRTRAAVRELFAERFSSAELDKLRAEAEAKDKAVAADSGKPQQSLGIMEKLSRFTSGEPHVADTSEFYRTLGSRLIASQTLPAEALPELARARAAAIGDALKASGIDAARISLTTVTPLSKPDAKSVPIELALSAK